MPPTPRLTTPPRAACAPHTCSLHRLPCVRSCTPPAPAPAPGPAGRFLGLSSETRQPLGKPATVKGWEVTSWAGSESAAPSPGWHGPEVTEHCRPSPGWGLAQGCRRKSPPAPAASSREGKQGRVRGSRSLPLPSPSHGETPARSQVQTLQFPGKGPARPAWPPAPAPGLSRLPGADPECSPPGKGRSRPAPSAAVVWSRWVSPALGGDGAFPQLPLCSREPRAGGRRAGEGAPWTAVGTVMVRKLLAPSPSSSGFALAPFSVLGPLVPRSPRSRPLAPSLSPHCTK